MKHSIQSLFRQEFQTSSQRMHTVKQDSFQSFKTLKSHVPCFQTVHSCVHIYPFSILSLVWRISVAPDTIFLCHLRWY